MKIRLTPVVVTILSFGFCVATGAWLSSYAAQPDSDKKPETTVKHKKVAPQKTAPRRATNPQGNVTQPEVQRGY